MSNNRLFIAAAGSGKTTFLIDDALQQGGRVLISTYTQANEAEIKKKIIKIVGCIPENIIVQTWFSFLLRHGARPYQGALYQKDIKGMVLVNQKSAPFTKETNTQAHYFNVNEKIFSDKLTKFVLKCNDLSRGAVIDRLSRIFSHIYIDEVQDLASYDLDFLKLLFDSNINTLLVGDPRQVIYVTHNAPKYSKYSNGKIADFIRTECKENKIIIDENTLNHSHRNNSIICSLASKIFPDTPKCEPCDCPDCRATTQHDGVFLVQEADIESYLRTYKPTQLRYNKKTKGINKDYPVFNFGLSKGLSYNRVLIFPTTGMRKWLANNKSELAPKTRAQLYVGVTRARYSVGIIYNFNKSTTIEGARKYYTE